MLLRFQEILLQVQNLILQARTITNLTIELTGMANGETLTLTNGTVKNLTVKDKTGVILDIDRCNSRKQYEHLTKFERWRNGRSLNFSHFLCFNFHVRKEIL